MTTIRKEAVIEACPDRVWGALRNVGALQTRRAPGFVTDTKLEPDALEGVNPTCEHENPDGSLSLDGGTPARAE